MTAPSPDTAPSVTVRRRRAVAAIGALAAVGAGGLVVHGPIPQDDGYHHFADDRALAGVANLLDVASNLPFLLVAALGAGALRAWGREARPPTWAWWGAWTFLAGVALTCVGSAVYHLDPRNATLVFDRLPMALAFGAFFALLLGDRLGDAVGRRALVPSVVLGVVSVAQWAGTLGAPGADDLRLYGVVQFLPVVAGVVFLLLLPPPREERRWLLAALAAYGLAKALESLDAPVFRATGSTVSGHTLKHVAAAVAAFALLRWITSTRRAPST